MHACQPNAAHAMVEYAFHRDTGLQEVSGSERAKTVLARAEVAMTAALRRGWNACLPVRECRTGIFRKMPVLFAAFRR
jgi:hypothetical protein